jgi:predicted permease
MIRDLLGALRWLRRNPLFAAAVVFILGAGIGANTAAFSIVDAVLLRPLPYRSPSNLVRVEETSPKRAQFGISAADYLRLRDRTDLFETSAPYLKDMVTLTGIATPDQVFALRTSGRLFALLGTRAALGRGLVEADDGSPHVAVLSDRLWQRLFHGDRGAIGRRVAISDEAFTVVGVMPPEFDFPGSEVELWTPLHLTPAYARSLQMVARLRAGRSLAAVQSALRIVAQQLERQAPREKAGLDMVVSPWREELAQKYKLSLVFILAAVGLVLLIACADAGSLLLCRALQRRKEIAIRASLGAGWWRVARQLLAESLVLAVAGSAAGIAVAHFALRFLLRQLAALPFAVPHMQRVALNQRVMLFNTILCLALACILSLLPVFLASRTDLQTVLRTGLAAGRSRGSARAFSLLIAAEAAFAFLLLVGSGLMMRSLIRLEQSDHGLQPDHVLTMRVPIGTATQPRPAGRYDSKASQMAYYAELLERLRQIPGVRYVAVVNNPPLSSVNTTTVYEAPDGTSKYMPTRTISEQYFAAMGIPVLAGRPFNAQDQSSTAPAVGIINRHLARELFGNRDPVEQILPVPGSKPLRVVGVVKDSPQMSYDQPANNELYIPYRQFIFGVFMSTIVVRTSGEPLTLAAALSKAVWAVDPDQPIVKVETMNDVIADSIWRPRFSAWVFTVLGGLALLLTSAGVYSVVSYTATLRAREVGIRVALGATPANVVATILRGAMLPLAAGLAVSLAAALLLSRLLASLLYEIGSNDPVTYAVAVAVLLATGAVASARPAWRAAAGDPLQALRTE